MVPTREMERLVRSMLRQKVDPSYIRHYLQAEYQADDKLIDIIFRKLNVIESNDPKRAAAKPSPHDRFGSFFR